MPVPVHFFLSPRRSPPDLESFRLERDWAQLNQSAARWIVQTYLRLHEAGCPVTFGFSPPSSGLIVFHNTEKRELLRALASDSRNVLVGIRADRREAPFADFELVQNSARAGGRRRLFVPYWPQPGLLPRDRERGALVEHVSYKGFASNLDPYFSSPHWRQSLAARGIRWSCEAQPEGPFPRIEVNWHDYRDVDVLLAVRRRTGRGDSPHKPANKLVNAWLAGTPALLSPDSAFVALRRSDLDFLEIRCPQDACAAVDRLRSDPALYSAMVENGRLRARAFTPQVVVERWVEVLFELIPAAVRERTPAYFSPAARALRSLARRLTRRVLLRSAT